MTKLEMNKRIDEMNARDRERDRIYPVYRGTYHDPWDLWFAWYPVHIGQSKWVWWRWVAWQYRTVLGVTWVAYATLE